jgi:hypothetical protein
MQIIKEAGCVPIKAWTDQIEDSALYYNRTYWRLVDLTDLD